MNPDHAAPTLAAVPTRVTPPDEPGAITRPVRIIRGVPPQSVPISVAQVSAAAAAIAPSAATGSRGSPVSAESTSNEAYTPPFAATCLALLPLESGRTDSVRAALRTAPRRVTSDDATK